MKKPHEIEASELLIESLGPCEYPSPLQKFAEQQRSAYRFVDDSERVLFEDNMARLRELFENGFEIPSMELAGPRRKIFYDPKDVGMAIVTCGGLCPGLNNVIRGIVLEAYYRYGVRRIYGIRNGFRGFIPSYGHQPVELTPEKVANIHFFGGTILSSSRGSQDPARIVDWLQENRVNILFVVGGDGSQRGALTISNEVKKRGAKISIVGIPKTIDNDLMFLDKSFGFETAFGRAVEAIECAHTESLGAPNGIGIVKVMGRCSGFIACHATLALGDVNFVLIPEVPFVLEGPNGLLAALEHRLKEREHAVIVVAEGAGQDLIGGERGVDASGNVQFADIGIYLRDQIRHYFQQRGIEVNIKYIDPSYEIRSIPAGAQDALFCARLAQNAVHAGMSGRTGLVVARWRGNYVHLPISLVTSGRQTVDTHGDLWQAVLATTGQPARFTNDPS